MSDIIKRVVAEVLEFFVELHHFWLEKGPGNFTPYRIDRCCLCACSSLSVRWHCGNVWLYCVCGEIPFVSRRRHIELALSKRVSAGPLAIYNEFRSLILSLENGHCSIVPSWINMSAAIFSQWYTFYILMGSPCWSRRNLFMIKARVYSWYALALKKPQYPLILRELFDKAW